MIHAFAIEPALVATWGKREVFRFVHDKFGLGTPRVLLELPAFTKWKKAVYAAANQLDLSQEDLKRIEELFRLFGEHKFRRVDTVYDGLLPWLENAETEYGRRPFAAVVAAQNPRNHVGVLAFDQLGPQSAAWACELGASPSRTPAAFAAALSGMLMNCRALHLIDPHFGPENVRHRAVLQALMEVLARHAPAPEIVRVHCEAKSELTFFEREAAKMASRLPDGCAIEFVRWRQRSGGEKLHNRYILTDIGGVAMGVGLDSGEAGETDDILLLPRSQYQLRWSQYASEDGAFERIDAPATVRGIVPRPSNR